MGRLSSTFPTAQAVDAALKRANKAEADMIDLDSKVAGKVDYSDYATKTQDLQEQINNIVTEASESGDVSYEVAQARVGADGTSYQTLKGRLDAERDALTHTEDVNILSMSQEGKKTLDKGKMTFKGIIDPDTGVLRVSSTETLGAGEKYIPLEIGKKYTISTKSTRYNLFYYDSNKNYLGALFNPQNTTAETTVINNTDYAYLRITAYHSGTITQEMYNEISVYIEVDNLKIHNAELVPMDFIEVDTVNGTLKFTGTTQIRNGKVYQTQLSANTVYDISDILSSGGFLYYDYNENSVVTRNNIDHKQVLIGAVWSAGKVVLFAPDYLVKINGCVLGNKVWDLLALNGVNVDYTAKTMTFGVNSYFTDGYYIKQLSTEPYSIDGMTTGAWLYYDYKNDTFTKSRSNDTILVGAVWANGSVQFSGEQHLVESNSLPVVYGQRFFNKTVNCLGDSMTDASISPNAYHKWFSLLCGVKRVVNYGLGGSCIAPKKEEYPTWENGIGSFLERYSSMGNAEVITVFGGVNDWVTGRTLGTINDTTDDTFYGSMHLLCQGLLAKYPTSRIYFFTSPQNDYVHRKANIPSGNQYSGNIIGKNRKGNTLIEFVDAMKEVCGIYGIPCKDLYRNSWWGLSGVLGIQGGEAGVYGSDSLHPNAEGHKVLAIKMASFMNGN